MIGQALNWVDSVLPGPATGLWCEAHTDAGEPDLATPADTAAPGPGPSAWALNTPTVAAGLADSALSIRPSPGGPVATLRFRRDGEAPTDDGGIWRRLRVGPFAVRFWNPDEPAKPGEHRPERLRADKGIRAKLLAEREGILAWMAAGCREWRTAGGLSASPATSQE